MKNVERITFPIQIHQRPHERSDGFFVCVDSNDNIPTSFSRLQVVAWLHRPVRVGISPALPERHPSRRCPTLLLSKSRAQSTNSQNYFFPYFNCIFERIKYAKPSVQADRHGGPGNQPRDGENISFLLNRRRPTAQKVPLRGSPAQRQQRSRDTTAAWGGGKQGWRNTKRNES